LNQHEAFQESINKSAIANKLSIQKEENKEQVYKTNISTTQPHQNHQNHNETNCHCIKNYQTNPQISQKIKEELIELEKIFPREKVEQNKKKENDEWAIIAKYNYYKSLLEKKEQLIKEKEKTSKLSNSLSNQINEKLKAKNNLDSLEKKFLEEQKELLKKQDEKEKLAKQEKEKKSTEEKEIRDKILRQSMDIKQKHKNDKMEFERKNLDKWKEEVKEEELKKKTRKNSEINIFHQILQENQDKINKAKINKEEELNQNKKFLDEYTKILEKTK